MKRSARRPPRDRFTEAGAGILPYPCHSAAFDPAHDGVVISGPTSTPLSKLPIRVDTASGSIFLAG